MKTATAIIRVCLFFCLILTVIFTRVPKNLDNCAFLSPSSVFKVSKTANKTNDQNTIKLTPLENREITNIIVHVNTRHDPYKHAVKNIEKTMQWDKNTHVYEHVVPWAYSNLKHEHTTVPWDDNAKYLIPHLKGNSFVLTGGGKSFCHFLAFDTLLKQIKGQGLKHAEVHFPFDSIYASYYFPGDEEMSNLMLNETLKYDQPRIFETDMARLQEFQEYFDAMTDKGINFTLHFTDGATKTVINNTADNALRIDLFMWETLDTMNEGVSKMEQNPKSVEFSHSFTKDKILNAVSHIRDYIFLHKRGFGSYVFKQTSLKGQDKIISETIYQYLDILKNMEISSFFDSNNAESLLVTIDEKSYLLEAASIASQKDLNIFILNFAKNILLTQTNLTTEETKDLEEAFANFFLKGFTRDDQILTGGSYGELDPDFVFDNLTPLNLLTRPIYLEDMSVDESKLKEFIKTHFTQPGENIVSMPDLKTQAKNDFSENDKALNMMRIAA